MLNIANNLHILYVCVCLCVCMCVIMTTLGISFNVIIPKPIADSSGGYIRRPLVFCSSGKGQLKTRLI